MLQVRTFIADKLWQCLLDTLREVSNNKRHCIYWEINSQLADDPEPIVRADLMEQVPQIALFCQENQSFITNAFSKHLLPILIRYLSDQNNVVWQKKSGNFDGFAGAGVD
jgi:serine/threonine-protein phosphatase 4 regulatory subunit 1